MAYWGPRTETPFTDGFAMIEAKITRSDQDNLVEAFCSSYLKNGHIPRCFFFGMMTPYCRVIVSRREL